MAFAVAAAAILFAVLDARRRALTAPQVDVDRASVVAFSAPPALYVPPEILPAPLMPPVMLSPAPPPSSSTPAPVLAQPTQTPPSMQPNGYPPEPSQPASPLTPPRVSTGPALVIDTGMALPRDAAGGGDMPSMSGPGSSPGQGAGPGSAGGSAPNASRTGSLNTDRARAGVFANRPTTVVQGTLIAAVLESALDTTRPGFARALVSRDIRSFDGSRILIPRGSRLIGEVEADTQTGQKRALINWTRLIRPDGVTIALESPASDTLGGTGVRAKVNTHFWERFSGAILQSALDIGVNLATREVGGTTVIALPGAINGVAAQTIQPREITPTLTVRRGTSISVFVARDLDFTDVERK
ncbi:type IV secretion system protein VirB10 [Sphingobium sp. B1D7B]|uniref:TrbI/VirB10 family protein n=1 Tax=Sphingobium sp. B1D7B TaxID=2940578 RepID=UPI0022250AA1|nr:TrbI/VirB10 family protein [Sphingobium sp. B1D7B]MCW2404404.1 type IV secretion system protein VirB10 [Sphingobium sp. B1D7B]